jgi:hypothetical protein
LQKVLSLQPWQRSHSTQAVLPRLRPKSETSSRYLASKVRASRASPTPALFHPPPRPGKHRERDGDPGARIAAFGFAPERSAA